MRSLRLFYDHGQRQRVMLRRTCLPPATLIATATADSKLPFRQIRRLGTLLGLQRTHGNAFVQRLVQRKLISDFVGNLVPAAAGGSRCEGASDRPSREQAVRCRWCNRLRWVYELATASKMRRHTI